MQEEATIGQLSQKTHIEWTIEDIFSYTMVDKFYDSPRFYIDGSRWFLRIYPNGRTKMNSAGWISLFLQTSEDSPSGISANYCLDLKKADGTIEPMSKYTKCVFDKAGTKYGCAKFLERSALLRRKLELATSDALTVICSSRVSDRTAEDCRSTLSKNFSDLFISKRGCDTTLRVQHQEFPVHRYILAARSTVFQAMFQVDMKENQTGVVDIVDCDPEAFRDFLLFLYSGKFAITSNKVFELYRIADKYCVEELRSSCVLYMTSHLSVWNVCETAVLADDFGEGELQSKTQLFFNDNFGKISTTADWDSLLETNRPLAKELLKKMASAKVVKMTASC